MFSIFENKILGKRSVGELPDSHVKPRHNAAGSVLFKGLQSYRCEAFSYSHAALLRVGGYAPKSSEEKMKNSEEIIPIGSIVG